ncbi:Monoamine oxidase N-like protein [Elsinoe fawcettii]|nr:Monoamine oxidase N-like protein [Elsinoe fawcettii]
MTSREGVFWTPEGITRGLKTSAIRSSDASVRIRYDAVVLGAGFAGLVAARELSRQANAKVLLIEARDRIGGRTWTAQALGEDFEMGGTWVHWTQPHLFAEAHRYGLSDNLKTSNGTTKPEAMPFRSRGVRKPEILEVASTDALLEVLFEDFFTIDGLTARDLMPFPHSSVRTAHSEWCKYDAMSIKDRLDEMKRPSQELELIEAHLKSFGSCPNDQGSYTDALRWYALGSYSVHTMYEATGCFKFGKGGTTALAGYILDDFAGDQLFDCVVESLVQHNGEVTIGLKSRPSITATYVVCTIPLNCLSDINFQPPLELLRQEALRDGHTNRGAKIHFKIAKQEPDAWFANTSDDTECDFIFSFSDHNGTADANQKSTYCIGFGLSDRLTDPSDSEKITSEFEKLVPGAKPQAYLTHDWMNDPFAKGTWYFAKPGATTRYLQQLQKPVGNIYMASADWADGWRGFIDGAIEQGIRAGIEVKKAMSRRADAVKDVASRL